jgi:hypothetical protein
MKHIPLTGGRFAIVSDRDYARLSKLKWSAWLNKQSGIWYAQHTPKCARRLRLSPILMHRLVKAAHGQQIDHRNRNGLDNRRCNLRVCSPSQNQWNSTSKPHSSRYKGVCLVKRARVPTWRAQIMAHGQAFDLGWYRNEEEAARAYDASARRLFGSFARTNEDMGLLLAPLLLRA